MKLMPIIRAAAAGVTALYYAVESAKHSAEGEGTEAYESARQFRSASDDLAKALGELSPKTKSGLDYYANNVRPVFHGSDDS